MVLVDMLLARVSSWCMPRIVCVHSELCAKASHVHTQLRPWSAERLDELMQWYSSLWTLRVQNLDMKLLPSLPFPLS